MHILRSSKKKVPGEPRTHDPRIAGNCGYALGYEIHTIRERYIMHW